MEKSFAETITIEIARLLSPLKRLNNAASITTFINELGWKFEAGVVVSCELSGLVNMVETLAETISDLTEAETDEEAIKIALSLAEQIPDIISKLRDEVPKFAAAITSAQNFVGEHDNIADKLLKRLFDNLVYRHLYTFHRKIFAVSHLMGIVEIVNDSSGMPIKTIQWSRIPKWISHPLAVVDNVYQWDSDFDGDAFLERLDAFLKAYLLPGGVYHQNDRIRNAFGRQAGDDREMRIPIHQAGRWPDTYEEFDLNISPIPAVPDTDPNKPPLKKAGLALYPYLFGGVKIDQNLSDTWKILVKGNADLGSGLAVLLRAPHNLEIKTNLLSNPLDSIDARVEMSIRKSAPENKPILIFGSEDGSRLGFEELAFNFLVALTQSNDEIAVELEVKQLALVISAPGGDGFLQKILSGGKIGSSCDLVVGYSSLRGVYFRGSGALEIIIPVHKTFGPISVDSVYIAVKAQEDGQLGIALATSFGARLGPVVTNIERLGTEIALSFPEGGNGNLGPLDVSFAFKPPNGAGLLLDSPTIKGGGYLAFYKGEYNGALQLQFSNIALKAVGIITTRMPDGSKGFSLLICISAEFPGIQLGFGFTLNGVGGLLGVNRSMVTNALQEGICKRTLDSILFPEDPVANIQKIISDMRTVFPATDKRYVIGPMGIIGWGTPTILRAEIGLILELPDPIRLALLGQIRLTLPREEKALVLIKMDVLGILDFERKLFALDARIYESNILQFALSGDMALRLNWGERPNFALSVGGLHPKFQPPPEFPSLRRIKVSMGSGNNPRLNLESYLAVTSNSVQFGAKLDLYADACGFDVEGHLGYDALFILSPFSFVVDIYGGVRIDGLSVGLALTLSGPTPWHVNGRASFKIWFVRFSVHFSATWGREEKIELPPTDPWPYLKEALANPGNWKSGLREGQEMVTSLRAILPGEQNNQPEKPIFVLPICPLEVRQKVLPLNQTITQFGNYKPSPYDKFEISSFEIVEDTAAQGTNIIEDYFAPAQFFAMSEAEKLSSPSFEKMDAGVTICGGVITLSMAVPTDVTYETLYVDKATGESKKEKKENGESKLYGMDKIVARMLFSAGAAYMSPFHRTGAKKFGPAQIKPFANINEAAYLIVSTEDMKKRDGFSRTGTIYTKARSALMEYLKTHPAEKGQWQIVPIEEVESA